MIPSRSTILRPTAVRPVPRAIALGVATLSALMAPTAQAAIDTLTAPERYGHAFALRVLVCDFSGQPVADVRSAPAEARPRPATAGRTGIGHTHHSDFDTE